MTLKFVDSIWERVERDRDDSDTSYFISLSYVAEAITKVTVLALIASLGDDRNRSRYSCLHRLARADGIGEWPSVLDSVLTGPSSQFLTEDIREDARLLTEKFSDDTWQFRSAGLVRECLEEIGAAPEHRSSKYQGRNCYHWLAQLRNRTRGHGAPSTQKLSAICPRMEEALRLIYDNFPIFDRPWAYLHQNFSGKYKVTCLGGNDGAFEKLKSTNTCNLPNGIYMAVGNSLHLVELIEANDSCTDFYLANGGFDERRFQLLSYTSGEVHYLDAGKYSAPAGELPASETHGGPELKVLGNVLTNAPSRAFDYVHRLDLEAELESLILDDRHPVVTLTGRGGIGKTSLALEVIARVAKSDRFDLVVWFSARDIDLLPEGPKLVKPDVLAIRDIADQYGRLTMAANWRGRTSEKSELLSQALAAVGEVSHLFVFDNFETIASPFDTYSWLDAHIRLPNKIMITTRTRDFKGDWPVEVRGMTGEQSFELIENVAKRYGLLKTLTDEHRRAIVEESGGHPYIIKMLLGQMEPNQSAKSIKRVLATSEDYLLALFERTYSELSAAGQRLFLTISNWNSTIPVVGLQAVMMRSTSDRIDVIEAVEELERRSLVEIEKSDKDGELFVSTPIAAQVFGKSKLAVSSLRSAVMADMELLHKFGAAANTDLGKGLRPRVRRFIKEISEDVSKGRRDLSAFLPLLEFLARRDLSAYLDIAQLVKESDISNKLDRAKRYIKTYISQLVADESGKYSTMELLAGWRQLVNLCSDSRDLMGELNAMAGLARVEGIEFYELSNIAASFSRLLSKNPDIDRDEKQILVRELGAAMERRLSEANATDFSRMAWLKLYCRDEKGAKRLVGQGLAIEPGNEHLVRLSKRLII